MKVSVIIPTYNSAQTICSTLDSVLGQTAPAGEVLVMDDGSTDNTVDLISRYRPEVTVVRQPNRGAAAARNALCNRASGDVMAFLDSDDLWHPTYLETQLHNVESFPGAAAFFTGHCDTFELQPPQFDDRKLGARAGYRIGPQSFVRQYTRSPGLFHMSFCCVPAKVLRCIGDEPFRASPAEDSYLKYLLALHGDIVYSTAVLGTVRIRGNSVSAAHLSSFRGLVQALELLKEPYAAFAGHSLLREFRYANASSKRVYAKLLMGQGRPLEARRALWRSLRDSLGLSSLAKSLALLALTAAPRRIQPRWPPSHRAIGTASVTCPVSHKS